LDSAWAPQRCHVTRQDTGRRLVTVTLIQSVPWTIGLCFSLLHFRRPYPDWLYDWLVISYGLLFIGQIRAWWIPYLFRPEPERAARYQIMFGKTHSFLPPCNGMVPNTAHILLHLATAATLIVLLMKRRRQSVHDGSSRLVGKPYLTRLGKSSPLLAQCPSEIVGSSVSEVRRRTADRHSESNVHSQRSVPPKGSLSSEMSQSKGNGILITFVRCSALGSKRESHIWVVGSRIGDAENHCRYRWPRVQPRGS
jgi:hypothetical protein